MDSLAAKRFNFWDSESRRRPLEAWETDELERAMWEMRRNESRDLIRAQAAPARKRRGAEA
jgi:hypothetical protein